MLRTPPSPSQTVGAAPAGAGPATGSRSGKRTPSLAPWYAVAALTALGALLRFPTLDVQSFWLDEATTVRLVGFDLGGLLSAVAREEVTPPLYYVLAWAWAAVLGTGEVGLRSLSALLGTALVPVAYLVARELASRRTALLTGALVAASPLLVWYSQEARSYALLALLGAASLLFFLRASRTGRGADLAGWALASALALATHYFALFLVVGEAVWLLAVLRRRSVAATAAVGTVGLAGLALLPVALAQQAGPGVDWIGQHPLLGRALLVPKKFLVGETGFLIPGARALVALLVLAALVMLVRTDPDERRPAWWGVTLGALVVVPALVLALVGLDYLLARNLIVAWVPAALVIAAGPTSRRAGRPGVAIGTALVIVLAAVSVATTVVPGLGREDWRGLAAELAPVPGGRMIAVMPPHEERSLRRYLGGLERARGGERPGEVAVVQTNRAGPQRTPPAPPGYALVGRRERQRLTVIRYRAVDAEAGVSPGGRPDAPRDLLLQRGR